LLSHPCAGLGQDNRSGASVMACSTRHQSRIGEPVD
jgi:hypothetical protein